MHTLPSSRSLFSPPPFSFPLSLSSSWRLASPPHQQLAFSTSNPFNFNTNYCSIPKLDASNDDNMHRKKKGENFLDATLLSSCCLSLSLTLSLFFISLLISSQLCRLSSSNNS